MTESEKQLIPPPKAATKKCEWEACGKEFVPRRYWQRFCSNRCRELQWVKVNAKAIKIQQIEAKLSNLKKLVNSIKECEEREHVRGQGQGEQGRLELCSGPKE